MSTSTKREKDKLQQQHIKVFIRSRPLNKQELEASSFPCIDIVGQKELILKEPCGKRYIFDTVFGPMAKQLDIYTAVVKPLIPEVLAGYNCTVFAYGQTGTGKTFTMAGGSASSSGVSWQDDQDAGIIPHAMAQIFDELYSLEQQYTVRVSYLELYNEELVDLLSDNTEGKSIRLFEDQHQKGSVIISGITKETVYNKHEVYEILQKGEERRHTAFTLMNAQSSRSHTVFTIMLHTCETTVDGEELVKTGKLNLVDLAGSENISRSGAVDIQAREAGNINQSLLTLERVIKSLFERSAHIPYRESKLTRILQDSLGGRTKTCIIATISPASACLEETLSTLDYANRAQNICNRPEANQRVSQTAWKAEYEKGMQHLQKNLDVTRTNSGIYLDKENYDRILADTEVCEGELAETITILRDLERQIKAMQEDGELRDCEWRQLKASFKSTQEKLFVQYSGMMNTVIEKREKEHLTSSDQARYLLQITNETIDNLTKKVENLNAINSQNNEAVKKVSEQIIQTLQEIINEVMQFMADFKDTNEEIGVTMSDQKKAEHINYVMTAKTSKTLADQTDLLLFALSRDLQIASQAEQQCHEDFVTRIKSKLQQVQDMSAFLNLKLKIQAEQKEFLGNIDQVHRVLHKQQRVTNATRHAIKNVSAEVVTIEKSVKSINKTLEELEQNVGSCEVAIQECKIDLTNSKQKANDSILLVSELFQQNIDYASSLLSATVNVVEEQYQNESLQKVIDKLHQTKDYFASQYLETNLTSHEISVDDVFKNVKTIAHEDLQAIVEALGTSIERSDEIKNKLSGLNENILKHEISVWAKVNECQDNLSGLTKTTGNVSPGSTNPPFVQLDPKFRTEQALNVSQEVEKECQLLFPVDPLENLESGSSQSSNVLQSDIQHVESEIENSAIKQLSEPDKEKKE